MEGVEDIPGAALHEGLPWTWQSFPEFLDALDGRHYDVDLATHVPARRAAAQRHGRARGPARDGHPRRHRGDGEAGRRGGRGRRHRLQHLAHPQPPQLQRRAHAHPHGRRRRAARDRPCDRRHRHRRAAGRVRLRRRRRRVRAVPLDGRGVGSAALVLARRRRPGQVPAAARAARSGQRRRGADARPGGRPSHRHPRGSAVHHQPARRQPGVAGDRRALRWRSRRAPCSSRASRSGSWPPPPSRSAAPTACSSWATRPTTNPTRPRASRPARPARAAMPSTSPTTCSPRTRAARSSTSRSSTGSTAPSTAWATMLAHQHTVPGLSDGGAHVGTICDASFPTTFLSYWGRDRDEGRLDLAYLVRQHTKDTAETVGLLDRGVLAPGYRADVNLIDFDALRPRRPEMRHDLPAGGKRLLQRADGYVATIVKGRGHLRARRAHRRPARPPAPRRPGGTRPMTDARGPRGAVRLDERPGRRRLRLGAHRRRPRRARSGPRARRSAHRAHPRHHRRRLPARRPSARSSTAPPAS